MQYQKTDQLMDQQMANNDYYGPYLANSGSKNLCLEKKYSTLISFLSVIAQLLAQLRKEHLPGRH